MTSRSRAVCSKGTLKKLGHDVLAVEDGTQAVATLLEPDGPRMAILDWMMPGCDGLAVCREVRKRAAPYTYVILLTSRDRRSDMVEALDAEVDDFLTKPYDAVECAPACDPANASCCCRKRCSMRRKCSATKPRTIG
jgi:sigma-B regulation protein RsbU (phosphoserine phosphatase)